MSARDDLIGGGYAAAAAVAFGGVTVLGKHVTDEGLDVTSLLAIRFGSGALLLFAILAAMRRPLRAAPGEGWKLLVLGVTGYGLEAGFFYLSLSHGTATATTLLFATYPIMVALASIALGRGMPGWLIGGSLVAAVAGTVIVVGSGGGIDISAAGVVFAMASAVTFTAYLLGAEVALKETSSLTGSAWVSASAALGLLTAALVTGNAEVPDRGITTLTAIGMGAGTALAFVAFFAALRRLGAVRTSVVSALEPVAAAAFAIVFLSEPLRAGLLIGGALILAGAVAASIARALPTREPTIP